MFWSRSRWFIPTYNVPQSVKSKLQIQENTSTDIIEKLESFFSDIILLKKENNELITKIDFLWSKLEINRTANSYTSFNQFNLDIVQELKECESKCYDIIIFNVKE